MDGCGRWGWWSGGLWGLGWPGGSRLGREGGEGAVLPIVRLCCRPVNVSGRLDFETVQLRNIGCRNACVTWKVHDAFVVILHHGGIHDALGEWFFFLEELEVSGGLRVPRGHGQGIIECLSVRVASRRRLRHDDIETSLRTITTLISVKKKPSAPSAAANPCRCIQGSNTTKWNQSLLRFL